MCISSPSKERANIFHNGLNYRGSRIRHFFWSNSHIQRSYFHHTQTQKSDQSANSSYPLKNSLEGSIAEKKINNGMMNNLKLKDDKGSHVDQQKKFAGPNLFSKLKRKPPNRTYLLEKVGTLFNY